MSRLTVRGWESFQHYKDRSPPWIKLHKTLLDNYEFQRLPLASRALAPMVWLLASESSDGSIDADIDKLAFRLHQSAEEIAEGLKYLIEKDFLIDASGALAGCLRDACLETEAETETDISLPEKKPAKQSAEPDGFAAFWALWPKHDRKAARGKCLDTWRRNKCEPMAGQILAHVRSLIASDQWRDHGGKFIPAPLVYLNKQQWDGAEVSSGNLDFWTLAGFANKWEAESAGCYARNASQFRNGCKAVAA